MVKYEVLVLSRPEITETEASNIETQLSSTISKAKGKILSWERWGKYHLAYSVKGNEYGVYYLTRFEIPPTEKDAVIKEIKSLMDIKFNDIVMRYLISHLEANELEYKKPTALDESHKGVDEFLKENKMEGLIKEKPEMNNKSKKHKSSVEELQNG